jgi:regulatory protein
MKSKKNPDPLKKSLMLLSRKMLTEKQLRDKLQKENLDWQKVEEAIEKLKVWGYLDDRKYLEEYLRSKRSATSWGYWKIREKLKEKGLPEELIELLRELYPLEDEIQDAKRLLENWVTTPRGADQARLLRKLAAKGFSHEAIQEAWRRYQEDLSLP